MEGEEKNLSEYISAIRRRWVGAVAAASVVLVLAVAVALLLPRVYTSTATILIEEQDIPPDLVRSTVTTYAWQRIQTITQRVMTRATLLNIIEKHDLYADKRRRKTSEEIIEQMRKDIKVESISADVIDPRSGRPMSATIAFTLSYEGERADTAQKVANELTTLYLNENLKTRTERARETFDFLTEEANRLGAEIAELETNLARFKERNADRLPELSGFNYQLIDRTERDLLDTESQIRALDERKFYLEEQLTLLNPTSPVFAPTGERIHDPVTRLKILKTEHAAAAANYSAKHPDVIRLRQEIEALEKSAGGPVAADDEQARALIRLRTELAASREKYGEQHPDVVRLRTELAGLETSLSETKNPETKILKDKPDNPAYINTQTHLDALNAQRRSLENKRVEITARLADYEKRIALSPQVERQYLELRRNHENAQLKYREIKAKQMEAQVGQQLEKERKGERFSLIDPPQLPEQPSRPNRQAIVLFGIILALAGGVAYLVVAEMLDRSVRSPRAIAAMLGVAPLTLVPIVENSADATRRRRRRRFVLRSAVATIIVAGIAIQFLWLPWDVLWFKGLRILSGG